MWNKPTTITSWSYSRFSVYEKCPAKAKYKFIDKLPDPGNEAMERGNLIHKLAEQYVKGEVKKLPPELSRFKDEFKELKKSKPMVEESWSFTKDWKQTTWNDWANCAVRIKVDAACLDKETLYVIDHKTGKKREGYSDQLSLYALAGALIFPAVKKISTQLWFLDSGEVVADEYNAAETPELQKEWDRKVKPMLNDKRFVPKPSHECRWCPFSKSKGGPCKF